MNVDAYTWTQEGASHHLYLQKGKVGQQYHMAIVAPGQEPNATELGWFVFWAETMNIRRRLPRRYFSTIEAAKEYAEAELIERELRGGD